MVAAPKVQASYLPTQNAFNNTPPTCGTDVDNCTDNGGSPWYAGLLAWWDEWSTNW